MQISNFFGINNVSAPERHKLGELTAALNVDIDATGALVTRRGRTLRYADCAHSLYQARIGLVGVIENDLVLFDDAGAIAATLYFALGPTRAWYAELPNGRLAFSNGLINGTTDGSAARAWGVAAPTDFALQSTTGETPTWLTYVRAADGLESAPLYGPATLIGAPLYGLPQRDGHTINVYYALNGSVGFLAGNTATDSFTYAGTNTALVLPCKTEHLVPVPVGRCLSDWGARTLVAAGNVLWATNPFHTEHVDARSDFLQLTDTITFVLGVDGGIWVGTTEELLFLRGDSFDTLKLERVRNAGVVLGSGVPADFTLFDPKARPDGDMDGGMCICGGEVVACGKSGAAEVFAAGKYKAAFTEVVATTRVRDGVLQYLASSA